MEGLRDSWEGNGGSWEGLRVSGKVFKDNCGISWDTLSGWRSFKGNWLGLRGSPEGLWGSWGGGPQRQPGGRQRQFGRLGVDGMASMAVGREISPMWWTTTGGAITHHPHGPTLQKVTYQHCRAGVEKVKKKDDYTYFAALKYRTSSPSGPLPK